MERTYDFTRCERTNGTFYGTGGKCRQGTEVSARVPLHQRQSLKDPKYGYTPLEKAMGVLKKLERRIKDPEYTPSDEEMLRYGRLKNAIEESLATKEGKDKEIRAIRKTPNQVEREVERAIENKKTSKRDFKDSLETLKEVITEREKNEKRGVKAIFGKNSWDRAEIVNTENLKRVYDKALKIFNNRFPQENFSEINNSLYDFTRCVRPNGTSYGTAGQCRSGVEEEREVINQLLSLLPKGEKVVDSDGKAHSKKSSRPISEVELKRTANKLAEVQKALDFERNFYRRMSSSAKYEDLRRQREERIEKLDRVRRKLNEKYLKMNSDLNAEAQRSGIPRPLVTILN